MEGHGSSSEAMAPFCSAAIRMVWRGDGAKGETEAVQPSLGGIVLEILHEAPACCDVCTQPLPKGVKDGHAADSSHSESSVCPWGTGRETQISCNSHLSGPVMG